MSLGCCKQIFPVVLIATLSLPLAAEVNPFAVNDGNIPDASEYDGPLFRFDYQYPDNIQQPLEMPWREVLNGMPLNKAKAHDYVVALKQFVEDPMRIFVTQPEVWNQHPQTGWYSMLWAGEDIPVTGWEGRDAIYGTYTGQIQAASVYADSGLTVDVRNHAAIYYNQTAAYALGRVWQDCDVATTSCSPSLMAGEAQFPEGSVIIKAAAATATPDEWPVLEGAAAWQIYRRPFNQHGTIHDQPPVVTDVRVAIFDIIVKDSVAAPDTGWVFSTLVYDRDALGEDAWDRMVPLGAMWGLDPDVNSALHPQQPLQQTYVNPEAPAYATVTLGYGGRLSGPFDIAVKNDVYVDGQLVKSLRSSSCMSCHGTVSYLPNSDKMLTYFYPAKPPISTPLNMYTPGSDDWNAWFTNRWGDQPQTDEAGAIALDYSTFMEMVLMNYASQQQKQQNQLSDEIYEQFWKTWRLHIQDFRH
ncbi:hypothetical protein LH51_08165 [Nitrincola sp. A-D6]|uniref:hypothetical protein n=1 Tax=Nitrincola sp. A-D6 TaxID=1545442 RepID=UPI00051FC28B|nr:hypothetical protein [Nitrincola sp. A-D6]KGK42316.1 hypothetical protein LH51_08165 [Nitrincola sp. A-D6]